MLGIGKKGRRERWQGRPKPPCEKTYWIFDIFEKVNFRWFEHFQAKVEPAQCHRWHSPRARNAWTHPGWCIFHVLSRKIEDGIGFAQKTWAQRRENPKNDHFRPILLSTPRDGWDVENFRNALYWCSRVVDQPISWLKRSEKVIWKSSDRPKIIRMDWVWKNISNRPGIGLSLGNTRYFRREKNS